MLLSMERYKKLFSFALVLEKFSLNKECEKKYKKFLILRLRKFSFEGAILREQFFLKNVFFENVFFE